MGFSWYELAVQILKNVGLPGQAVVHSQQALDILFGRLGLMQHLVNCMP